MDDVSLYSVFDWIDRYDRNSEISFKSVLTVIGDIWMSHELRKRYNVVLEIDFDAKNVTDLLSKCHKYSMQFLDASKKTVIYIDNVAFLEKRVENDITRFIQSFSKEKIGRSIPIVLNILFEENIQRSFVDKCVTMFVKDFQKLSVADNVDRDDVDSVDREDSGGDIDELMTREGLSVSVSVEDNGDMELTLTEYKQKLEKIIFF